MLRLTAARSEFAAAYSRKVDFATAHSRLTICIAPSSIPNRSATPQKSATLSKVGICCGSQPQGRFCYGLQPPDNLHSTIAKPRPFRYPSKIRNVIKGRNLRRLTAARSKFEAAHSRKVGICGSSQPSAGQQTKNSHCLSNRSAM